MGINVIEHNLTDFKDGIDKNNSDKSMEISYWISAQHQFDLNSDNKSKNRVNKLRPNRPFFGEVFAIEYGKNVGHEFKDLYLGLIFQNDNGNKYGNTTIVLPIKEYNCEEKFDNNIHFVLKNEHFESIVKNGLDKDPLKIILSDITTIDKARLGVKIGKLKPEIINNLKCKMKNILFLQ